MARHPTTGARAIPILISIVGGAMRIGLRLLVALLLVLGVVSLWFSYREIRRAKQELRTELQNRAATAGETLQEIAEEHPSRPRLQAAMDQIGKRQQLQGAVLYDAQGKMFAESPALGETLHEQPPQVREAMKAGAGVGAFVQLGGQPVYVYALPLSQSGKAVGGLAVFCDASSVELRKSFILRQAIWRVLAQAVLSAVVIFLFLRWSILAPIARATQWVHSLRTGGIAVSHPGPKGFDLLQPLAHEMTRMADSLKTARSSAEKEAQLRDAAESVWTAERLAVHVRGRLGESRIFVVSNREPYIHSRQGRDVVATTPASGLVTALEPLLCACDGTWIAHGSGDADKETVDTRDSLRVPPEEPRYTLRRVWLSREEEEGYYYGFSNEGLWPLCHIAHTRPLFREADWDSYRAVNEKFAQAVLEEIADTVAPVVLVQDYQFALLPQLIKKSRPDARVAIFWHIPWPNPEAFGICPWQREILQGLLGADLVGFHIQSHCNNFMETVDRSLQARVDWDNFRVKRDQHSTLVRAFPVSVEMQEPDTESEIQTESEQIGLLRELGVEALYLGVGVDRIDYTKGIPERLLAVERFLEKYPLYQGRFTFIQIGAPSRTHIKRYHDLIAEVELETERINWRFQRGKWKPIVFVKRQHSHEEVERYYRGSDLCLVTSLHDGMNLVAKEFVAARQDEEGVLVLSRFAGAASELRDALIVNPYNIEQTAEAIRAAIEMPLEEKRSRMQRLRRVVRTRNAYKWAAELVAELCEVRVKNEPEDLFRENEKALSAGAHGLPRQYRSERIPPSEINSGL